mgnify:CR=1 FL=1
MVGKYLFLCLLFIFNINVNASEIIYNKNNILITKQDLNQYKLIEKNINYLNDNIVIKEIVLIKRTNNNLKKNSKSLYNSLKGLPLHLYFKLKNTEQEDDKEIPNIIDNQPAQIIESTQYMETTESTQYMETKESTQEPQTYHVDEIHITSQWEEGGYTWCQMSDGNYYWWDGQNWVIYQS